METYCSAVLVSQGIALSSVQWSQGKASKSRTFVTIKVSKVKYELQAEASL